MAVGAVVALLGGFFGASWYLGRTPPPAVEAAEATPSENSAGTSAPRSGPIVVHGTGDVLLDASRPDPWSDVRDLFRSDDLSVVNLECSPGLGGEAEDKEFTFRCPRGFDVMRSNGVDVANLGNNHARDFGKQALLSGRASLAEAGVRPVGAGRNAAEANAPAVFELRGKTVAVLGFGGVVPSPRWIASASSPGVADGYDVASMAQAVRAADAEADIVIVTLHWGDELETQPNADDVARAHAMIDAGADAIFGHHSHVLQPLDFYEERPIFYSLGNFVWPRGGPTAVAEVVFRPDGSIDACLLPAYISGGRPTLTGPKSC
jgi:hypothetical protein